MVCRASFISKVYPAKSNYNLGFDEFEITGVNYIFFSYNR